MIRQTPDLVGNSPANDNDDEEEDDKWLKVGVS